MESLGINPVLLIAQIISFTILYAVLNRFLYPAIRKALSDRRQAIAKTFADRDEVKKQLEEFTKKQQLEQKKLLAQTQKYLAEAKKSAASTKQELLAQAQTESHKLLTKAQAEITRSQMNAKDEIAQYAKHLARQTVDSLLLEKSLDTVWQKDQLSQSLKKINHV